MNDENKIDLSIEMYEDLKETLVKAIKNAKAGGAGNAGLENVQLERIERLIEAAELSQEQITQLLEHLQRYTALPGIKTEQEREIVNKYDMLLQQLAGRLEVIDKENRKTHTLIEQVGQAVEALTRPDALPAQEHRHTYTLDIKSSKTALVIFVMAVIIVLLIGFIYRVSVSNQQLAVNDLKYRYVKMCGKIGEKELMELETVFWDEQYRNLRDTVRNQVERYEEAVRHRAEQLEQATVKERKAKRLLDDVKRLRGENVITNNIPTVSVKKRGQFESYQNRIMIRSFCGCIIYLMRNYFKSRLGSIHQIVNRFSTVIVGRQLRARVAHVKLGCQ